MTKKTSKKKAVLGDRGDQTPRSGALPWCTSSLEPGRTVGRWHRLLVIGGGLAGLKVTGQDRLPDLRSRIDDFLSQLWGKLGASGGDRVKFHFGIKAHIIIIWHPPRACKQPRFLKVFFR